MRTVFISLLMVAGLATIVAAQEAGPTRSAQSSFDYSLSTLLRSVEKLTLENRDLAAANDRMRKRLASLQEELQALQRDDTRVLEQYSALDDKYLKKAASVKTVELQVARLQEEAASLGKAMADISDEITAKEKADADLRLAADKKEAELRDLASPSVPSVGGDLSQLTGERDQLREQSRLGTVSLQRVREEWLELQGDIQGGPQRVESLKKDKDKLAAALEAKQLSCSRLEEKVSSQQQTMDSTLSADKIGPGEIAGLEKDIQVLKDKFQERGKSLAELEKGMEVKARKANDPAEVERRKLEEKIAEASEHNRTLRSGMDQLRRRMVDMDKKKVQLEKAIYGN